MQLTAPGPIVTKPFDIRVTQFTHDADTKAQTAVAAAVTTAGAKLDSFNWSGMELESMPPQHPIGGTVTGPSASVTAALAAIELLDDTL